VQLEKTFWFSFLRKESSLSSLKTALQLSQHVGHLGNWPTALIQDVRVQPQFFINICKQRLLLVVKSQ